MVRCKSGDLSRALIPITEAKKLVNMPSLPPVPGSIAEMLTGNYLNLLHWTYPTSHALTKFHAIVNDAQDW